eukprot:6507971-Prymnesium_polylepis.1
MARAESLEDAAARSDPTAIYRRATPITLAPTHSFSLHSLYPLLTVVLLVHVCSKKKKGTRGRMLSMAQLPAARKLVRAKLRTKQQLVRGYAPQDEHGQSASDSEPEAGESDTAGRA